MKVTVKMRREYHKVLVSDLERSHAFAAERVGFLFAKVAAAGVDHLLLFPVAYQPVRDEDYVPDESAGATFNTVAIREALQRARSEKLSALQIHMHDHDGRPRFSRTDRKTIDELARSFGVVSPAQAHGGLVLSRDSGSARVWLRGSPEPAPARVVTVGFPCDFGRFSDEL
jgi:hypothetical protein